VLSSPIRGGRKRREEEEGGRGVKHQFVAVRESQY